MYQYVVKLEIPEEDVFCLFFLRNTWISIKNDQEESVLVQILNFLPFF